jgi:hypothetical protein
MFNWFITLTSYTFLKFRIKTMFNFIPFRIIYLSFHRSICGITFGYRTRHSEGDHNKK